MNEQLLDEKEKVETAAGTASKRLHFLRCSEAPITIECGQSRLSPLNVDQDNDEARLGSAVHEHLKHHILATDGPSIAELGEMYRLESDQLLEDLNILTRIGQKVWDQHLAPRFKDPIIEESYGETIFENETDRIILKGHPDCVSLESKNKAVLILDWKSGRKKADYYFQTMSYVMLAAAKHGRKHGTATVVWLRDQTYEHKHFAANQLEWLRKQYADQVLGDPKYRVGEHCTYCPRFLDCPARHELSVAVANQLEGPLDLPLWKARAGVKMIQKLCDQWEKDLKQQVEHTGRVELGNGKYLRFDSRQRRGLDVAKAKDILAKLLPANELWNITSMSITKLTKALYEHVPNGKKKKEYVDGILESLEEQEAIVHHGYKTLVTAEDE